jgi:hypothetical protein
VADGQYHRAEILAVKKNLTLRVDGGVARSIVNEGANEFLDVRRELFVAGVAADVGEKAIKQWHLRNATSFNGEWSALTNGFYIEDMRIPGIM